MSVVHVKSKTPDAVYIGRGSPWGNPFVTKKSSFSTIDTLGAEAMPIVEVASRQEAIEFYRQMLWHQIKTRAFPLMRLAELNGKPLACYCAPAPCHGDVLMRAAAWAAQHVDERRAVNELAQAAYDLEDAHIARLEGRHDDAAIYLARANR